MDIEHSSITDPNIHEPKDISTANSGEVYVADGVGSGSWTSQWKKVAVNLELDDISTASTTYTTSPAAGTISAIYAVIHGAIGTSDVTLTSYINGTTITNGSIIIPYSGSAAGDMVSVNPTGANTVAAGSVISVDTNGVSTGSVRCTITVFIDV